MLHEGLLPLQSDFKSRPAARRRASTPQNLLLTARRPHQSFQRLREEHAMRIGHRRIRAVDDLDHGQLRWRSRRSRRRRLRRISACWHRALGRWGEDVKDGGDFGDGAGKSVLLALGGGPASWVQEKTAASAACVSSEARGGLANEPCTVSSRCEVAPEREQVANRHVRPIPREDCRCLRM